MQCPYVMHHATHQVPVSEAKQGATDRAIAKWLRTNGRARDEVVIASSAPPQGSNPSPVCCSRTRLEPQPSRANAQSAQPSRANAVCPA